MGISYDPGSRKWSVTPEQETFERKLLTENISFDLSGYYYNKLVSGGGRGQTTVYKRVFVPQQLPSLGKGMQAPYGYQPGKIKIDLQVMRDASEVSEWALQQALEKQLEDNKVETTTGNKTYPSISSLRSNVLTTNKKEVENNEKATELNNQYQVLETENKAKNIAYNTVMGAVNSTSGGDYVKQRDLIRQIKGIDDQLKTTLEDYYKAYYSNEKIERWNPDLAVTPLGTFDAIYYEKQNPLAAQQWQEAVTNDDIDITQRYGKTNFFLNHYTTQGKAAGARANKAEELESSKNYVEKTPTDRDLQEVRNRQLGVDVPFQTELTDVLNEALGEQTLADVERFGALTQDVLKQTIAEMTKAKRKEQELSMFSGLGSFGEIININKDLTNSILGDSGVGGVLSFMGSSKTEESLEKSLRKVTGVNNEIVYNWQQWFDDTLKQRYQNDIELGITKEETEERIQIEGQFARNFIDQYLIPRFNESRSMNEFVEYLDVRQGEQNPFQTQDLLNATKLVADLKARQYIEQLQKTPDRYFNSEFYFNPTGDKTREEAYLEQKETVNKDWELAKTGDEYWQKQAYRFGVDINDKDAFAKMHYQLIGRLKDYDAADDILNASKVSDYIYNQILPAIDAEALKQGNVFGQFLKPEEFADEMLKGLNPENKETWNEVLKEYGLDSFDGTINDLKEYIKEAFRTGSAQEIREQIKYLNEKREKPTQENLGIFYIQRKEDYKPTASSGSDTELYKVFQSAGFQGTEDEFYENFFPDVDRSEQVALTKAGKGDTFKTTGLDFSDPFASFSTVESFFNEDKKTETEPKRSSYFTIDEDEDLPVKSKAGQGFLDEFTSMFKGFS